MYSVLLQLVYFEPTIKRWIERDESPFVLFQSQSKKSFVPLEFMLGRSERCQISFPDAPATVSRQHASISSYDGMQWRLENKSKNGTMVNGRMTKWASLRHEDVIILGPIDDIETLFFDNTKIEEKTAQRILQKTLPCLQFLKINEENEDLEEMTIF